jgi:predicted DNA-binding protein (MmcQ/YjbR family)
MSRRNNTDAVLKELRAFGLGYPGTHLKSPWPGHMDLAVKDKTFAYLSVEGEPFSISCKLPRSNAAALMLPFTKPTEYGLGKSGWVTAAFAEGETLPIDMLKEWIDESYRAQAPKKLVAAVGAARSDGESKPKPKTTAAKAKRRAAPAKRGAAKPGTARRSRRAERR